MTAVSREDVIKALDYINNHISFKEARNIGVCKEEITIRQVLEDKLKQMDLDKHIKDMQDIYELRGTCYDSMQQLADKYNELKTIAEELKLVIDVERTWSETQKQLHEIELKDFKKVCDLAEEMYEALKSAYISQNNPHCSAPYHNETTRKIIGAISKYHQLKGEK
jgi:hypothetical protein